MPCSGQSARWVPGSRAAISEPHRDQIDGLAARGLLLVICLLWGGNVVALKLALDELPPLRMAAIRTGSAALVLAMWTAFRGDSMRLGGQHIVALVWISALHAGTLALQNLALDRTAASHVSILLYLYPILTALLAHRWLPDERLSTRAIGALALGFLGTLVTLGDTRPHARTVSPLGDGLAVGGALLWAVQTIRTKQLVSVLAPLVIVVYSSAMSSVMLAAASLAVEPAGAWPPPSSALPAIGYQVIVVDVACRIGWSTLLRLLHARVVTAYTFLTPAFGLLASVVVLGEALSIRLLIGLTLVALSLAGLDGRPHAAAGTRDGA